MTTYSASVIVPAHNAERTIGEQLAALAAQTDAPAFEVIVVANRCTDRTCAVAGGFSHVLALTIVTANEQASAAFARNAGAEVAKAPILLFCDADDAVDPRWVAEMVKAFDKDVADFVGGLIEVDRSSIPNWVYRWRYEFFDGRCIREQEGRLPYALSASLGVRARAFAHVGGFDTRFGGAGKEEVDLGWRLIRAGFQIGQAPAARIVYRPRRSIVENLHQARNYHRGGLILEEKEGTLLPAPRRLRSVVDILKFAGFLLLVQRERHPMVIYVRLRQRLIQIAEHRRFTRTRADAPTSNS